MLSVSFQDFRCFSDSGRVEILPITFLVGENSAGKTSFLAGVRFLLESLSRRSQASFNRDPYFLGGFDQIAHYRGGRGGRAKTFHLSLTLNAADLRKVRGDYKLTGSVTHRFTFGKGFPQPELRTYELIIPDAQLEVSLEGDIPSATLRPGNAGEPISIPSKNSPPSAFIRDNPLYLTQIIDGLWFQQNAGRRTGPEDEILPQLSQEQRTLLERVWLTFRSSISVLQQDVFASAPVRTQPLRTYTPSELVASSEGSHVPLELANAKLRSPARWKALKQGLVSFGKNSGMFSDIEIRQLGKSDVDPFQILVKVNGPTMNLVDVGYGVSQVLPIVYQMQNTQRYRTFLLQQPEVHLHPRAQAELGTLLADCITRETEDHAGPTFVVETHSDYIIDRIRIEIANKKINAKDVTIVFFERNQNSSSASNLYFDQDGEIRNVPPKFREFFMEEHAKLLGLN